jgi:hypothetical protein
VKIKSNSSLGNVLAYWTESIHGQVNRILRLTALFFLLHFFSLFHNFLSSLLIDSNRVPIQAVSYKLYSAKSVGLLAIEVLAEIHCGEKSPNSKHPRSFSVRCFRYRML